MDVKRIFRLVVCLVLVCALMVQVSPIKSKAVTDPLTFLVLEELAKPIAVGIAAGIGLKLGADFIEDADTVIGGLYDRYITWAQMNPDTAPATLDQVFFNPDLGMAYVAADTIEAFRTFLFDSGTVVETGVEDGYALYNGYKYPIIPAGMLESYPFAFIYKYRSTVHLVLCASSPYTKEYGSDGLLVMDNNLCYISGGTYWNENGSIAAGSGVVLEPNNSWYSYIWSNFNVYLDDGTLLLGASSFVGDYSFSVPDGFVLSDFASSDEVLSDGYPEWFANSIVVPGEIAGTEDDVLAYPIALGNNLQESVNFTQEQVWAGSGTYLGPSTDSGSDSGTTGTGDLAEIISILSTISEYQQTGTIKTQTKVDGLAEALGIANGTLADVDDKLAAILTANAFGFETVADSVNSLSGSMADVNELVGTIVGTQTGIKGDTEEIAGTLAGLLTEVKAIPDKMVDSIEKAATAVFVPSTGYVDSKVEALTANFPFAESIALTGKDLEQFFLSLGSEPPVVYIPLASSRGSIDWGSDMIFMDLSWYEEYKPTMDAVISAFLWLWFCWRMVLTLPGLISGASGMVGSIIDVSHIGSSGYSTTAVALVNDRKIEGHVYQSKENKQHSDSGYNAWRARRK